MKAGVYNSCEAGNKHAGKATPSLWKRPAEPLPSATPAKRAKDSQDDKPTPTSAKEPVNVLDFLKSRPQIAAMDTMRKSAQPAAVIAPLQSAKAVPRLVEESKSVLPEATLFRNPRMSAMDPDSDSWEQEHETVLEFLRRLPVADPDTARVGPWLWVRCARELQDFNNSEDLGEFLETTEPLLDGLLKQRQIIEQQNLGKAVGTITRKMGPYRDQLEVDLLSSATKHELTSGKWMIFTMADDIPLVWRQVAEATAAGKLGPTSKVGTWEPDNVTKPMLICVYTRDLSDLTDVKRVLSALNEFNIVNKAAKISYKCDAYTHLKIFSDNKYKLRASLYSSEEVRNDKVKYKEGVITRLKTKNGVMEEFLNS